MVFPAARSRATASTSSDSETIIFSRGPYASRRPGPHTGALSLAPSRSLGLKAVTTCASQPSAARRSSTDCPLSLRSASTVLGGPFLRPVLDGRVVIAGNRVAQLRCGNRGGPSLHHDE